MLTSSEELLRAAREGGYAVGAFDVWNLESVLATVAAAETERSPIILTVHPEVLRFGGMPFMALCAGAAHSADVPVALHLDGGSAPDDIRYALDLGFKSLTVYSLHLPYDRSLQYTRNITALVHEHGATAEAIFRPRDPGTSAVGHEASLIDPAQAADFVERTRVDALAIFRDDMGRWEHAVYDVRAGHFGDGDWHLDLVRLAQLLVALDVPLALNGMFGVPQRLIRIAIELGVAKLGGDAESGVAYLDTIQHFEHNLTETYALMEAASSALHDMIVRKLQLYGSSGRAASYSPLT
jgi:tagatose 1,6-diphosphate aldolase GatY/KbaY